MAVLVAGCAQDDQADPVTGSGPGKDMGGSVEFELVATDQLSVSPDGSQVLADCWNGICRWDAASGSLELVPDRGSVAVAPDWSTVAITDDAEVVLEDLDSGEPVAELSGLADEEVTDGTEEASFDTIGEVHRIAISPEGDRIATAGNGRSRCTTSSQVSRWSSRPAKAARWRGVPTADVSSARAPMVSLSCGAPMAGSRSPSSPAHACTRRRSRPMLT